MKVLLAHVYFIHEDVKEKQIMKPYAPLGLLYISAFLKKHQISHEVFDGTFLNEDALKQKIKEYKPTVLALYANLMTKKNIVRIMANCKKEHPEINIVLGGPDIRYNVENYLSNGADFLVIGEGEESFLELVEALQKVDADFNSIKGIAYKNGNEIKENAPRALLKNVDDLPSPAYESIDIQSYLTSWKNHHGYSMMSVSTQRGCPYTCKWCSTAVYGQSYRRRSPQKVVDELKALKEKYKVEAIWFVDDVFTVSHKWLKEFSELMQKEKVNLPFECISRADRMNEEVIQDLKKAGCFRIWIGAESGSQKIIDAMDRRVEVEKVRESILSAKKVGIETGTFIMLGYPGETIQDINETIDHLSISKPDHFTITLTYPIKGTSLYNEVEADLIGEFDWSAQSDRERDFKRNFDKNFYKHAVRHVVNEVNYRKSKFESTSLYSRSKLKIKSRLSRLLMSLNA